MKRADWTFSQYIEEIVMISEIIEIPGMKQKRQTWPVIACTWYMRIPASKRCLTWATAWSMC